MLTLDFSEAKTKHLLWLTKLQSYLDGIDGLTEEQIISSHSCDLGRWLDETGKMKYSSISEMQELEKAHDEIHETGAMIVKYKNSNDEILVQQYFLDLITLSARILSLLDTLEKKIAQP